MLECRNLELAVPGTYRAGKTSVQVVFFFSFHFFLDPSRLTKTSIQFHIPDSPVVTIKSFAPQLVVITSKQRPRKLTIHGSDGEEYAFLLKGHEDLRQDERVMQVISSFHLDFFLMN